MIMETPYCKRTNNSIDLDGDCLDKNCAMFKNLLFIYSGVDDEFHFIYKSDYEKIAVYSSHGRVYYTECWTIHAFEIVENLTVCTIDFQFQ